jgi:hypothetical protein
MGMYGIEPLPRRPAGVCLVEAWGGPDRQEVIPVHGEIQARAGT